MNRSYTRAGIICHEVTRSPSPLGGSGNFRGNRHPRSSELRASSSNSHSGSSTGSSLRIGAKYDSPEDFMDCEEPRTPEFAPYGPPSQDELDRCLFTPLRSSEKGKDPSQSTVHESEHRRGHSRASRRTMSGGSSRNSRARSRMMSRGSSGDSIERERVGGMYKENADLGFESVGDTKSKKKEDVFMGAPWDSKWDAPRR